jgi:hypothetical protein
MGITNIKSCIWRSSLLPKNINYKIPPPKHLIHHHLQIMSLIIINAHPNTPLLAHQLPQQLQPRIHQTQPRRMLQIIIIMFKRTPCIVRRVDVYALHLPRIQRQQRLKPIQVIPLDKHIIARFIAIGEFRHLIEHPVRRGSSGFEGFGFIQPVKKGHSWWFSGSGKVDKSGGMLSPAACAFLTIRKRKKVVVWYGSAKVYQKNSILDQFINRVGAEILFMRPTDRSSEYLDLVEISFIL